MKTLYTLLILLFGFIQAFAQDSRLDNLQSPENPATFILGVQPNSISSPQTTDALKTALITNFVAENGDLVVPNDFAIEFSPYWFSNPILTLDSYLYPNNLVFDQLIRNSSFSIASTDSYALGDSTLTEALGFGYRTGFTIRDQDIGKKTKNTSKYTSSLINTVFLSISDLFESDWVLEKRLSHITKNIAYIIVTDIVSDTQLKKIDDLFNENANLI